MSYNNLTDKLNPSNFSVNKITRNDAELLSITASAKDFYINEEWEDALINDILMRYINDNIQLAELAFKLRICINEAMNNAIIHGNCDMPAQSNYAQKNELEDYMDEFDNAITQNNKGALPISLDILLSKKKIKISIKDRGKGFVVEHIMQKLKLEYSLPLYNNKYAELKLPRIAQTHRRGLFLINNTCHKVKHSHNGSCINMYWDLNKMES